MMRSDRSGSRAVTENRTAPGGRRPSGIAAKAVTAALLINLLSGAQYCWSMLGSGLMEQHGWTILQVSLPYSVLFVTASVWSLAVGRIVDKKGPGAMIRLGAVLNVIGLAAAGNTDNWWLVLFSVGIVMGMAAASLAQSTSPTAIRFVPLRYKGIVTGIVSAGIGWTSFYMAPLIDTLLRLTDVSMCFTVIGVTDGALLFILSFFLPDPHKYSLEQENDDPGAGIGRISGYNDSIQTVGQALHTRETWILFMMLLCATLAGLVFTSQVTNIARVQAGITDSCRIIMFMGIVNGLGRLVMPALSDLIGVIRTWAVIFVTIALDMILFLTADSFPVFVAAVCLLSFFYGGSTPLMWATITDIFGKKYMGTIYGVVTNGYAAASVLGPVSASLIVQKTGSYTLLFVLIIIFSLSGLALVRYLSLMKIQENAENRDTAEDLQCL